MNRKARTSLRKQIIRDYRQRHYHWVMEAVPTMSDREWKAYQDWVAAFSNPRKVYASRSVRNLLRQKLKQGQADQAAPRRRREHFRSLLGANTFDVTAPVTGRLLLPRRNVTAGK